jgi:hypothetical protein
VTASLELAELRVTDPDRYQYLLHKTGLVSLDLLALRVDTRERLHGLIRRSDPFQRKGLPLELVVEIDVLGKAGMRAVIAEKDMFQALVCTPRERAEEAARRAKAGAA